jgi:hypothetical protein
MTKYNHLRNFLNNSEIIKPSSLARVVGWDKSLMSKWLNEKEGRNIPERVYQKILKELEKIKYEPIGERDGN